MLVGESSALAAPRARRKARAQAPAREAAVFAHGVTFQAPRGAAAAASGRNQAADTVSLRRPACSSPARPYATPSLTHPDVNSHTRCP